MLFGAREPFRLKRALDRTLQSRKSRYPTPIQSTRTVWFRSTVPLPRIEPFRLDGHPMRTLSFTIYETHVISAEIALFASWVPTLLFT